MIDTCRPDAFQATPVSTPYTAHPPRVPSPMAPPVRAGFVRVIADDDEDEEP